MKNKSTISLLVISLLSCAVAAGAYVLSIRTVEDKVEHAKVAIAEIANEEKKGENEKNLVEIMDATGPDRARLPVLFVSDDGIVDFIEEVESIGPSSGASLSLSAINAGDISAMEPGAIGSIKSHVLVNGPWASVMRTLRMIENMPYRVTVDNVRLDRAGEGRAASWKMDLDIDVLMMKSK